MATAAELRAGRQPCLWTHRAVCEIRLAPQRRLLTTKYRRSDGRWCGCCKGGGEVLWGFWTKKLSPIPAMATRPIAIAPEPPTRVSVSVAMCCGVGRHFGTGGKGQIRHNPSYEGFVGALPACLSRDASPFDRLRASR